MKQSAALRYKHQHIVVLLSAMVLLLAAAQTRASSGVETKKAQAVIDKTTNGPAAFRANEKGSITHLQSGMACLLGGGDGMSVVTLAVLPNPVTGNDVSCDYRLRSGKITVFATKLGAEGFDSYVSSTFASIEQMYPGARSISVKVVTDGESTREPVVRGYAVGTQQEQTVTAAWISERDGWAIKVRATYPKSRHGEVDLLAAALWLLADNTAGTKHAD
jgi:hypothetical protein